MVRTWDDSFYRGIGILGGHVTDPDRAGWNRDWTRLDRDRCINGTLEETRGNTGESETASTAEHRDIRRQGWRGRRESWPHTHHSFDQSPHRLVIASFHDFKFKHKCLARGVATSTEWIRTKDYFLFLSSSSSSFCLFIFFFFNSIVKMYPVSHLVNFYSIWWKCLV